jgi:hypothetical protein
MIVVFCELAVRASEKTSKTAASVALALIFSLISLLKRKRLQVFPEGWSQALPLQRKCNRGLQESQLIARIKTLALELKILVSNPAAGKTALRTCAANSWLLYAEGGYVHHQKGLSF